MLRSDGGPRRVGVAGLGVIERDSQWANRYRRRVRSSAGISGFAPEPPGARAPLGLRRSSVLSRESCGSIAGWSGFVEHGVTEPLVSCYRVLHG